jgi:hypothetical protein
MSGPYGLDFGSILHLAEARGARSPLLAEVLPDIELILLQALKGDPEDGGGEEG